ncbi:hypothetical protein EVAR_62703_1 [Eumeta japonica]|uniref:Uncharacterized protein n=1 Tax=Eumeta variegata TaxID=151549 RepID=A0A4C1ZM94_EUMVA|nr:hypothetical protein EVAR_62703_1 [Eumeta japonica]
MGGTMGVGAAAGGGAPDLRDPGINGGRADFFEIVASASTSTPRGRGEQTLLMLATALRALPEIPNRTKCYYLRKLGRSGQPNDSKSGPSLREFYHTALS